MRRFLLGFLIAAILIANVSAVILFLQKIHRGKEAEIPETMVVTEPTAVETTEAPTEAPTEPSTEQTLPPQTTAPVVEKTTIDYVPRYFQTDYPYIPFGNGTVATSGCSITCLAMVASFMTDQEYTPDQMAYHFGDYGGSNIERLEYGLAQMQLPYEHTVNVMDVLEALRSGKVAIVMMDEGSIFTTTQHFIAIVDMTEDGKFWVHDPIEDHYSSPEPYLRNACETGAEDYQIMRGFSGGWIFDKEDMEDVTFRFDASIPEQKENRYEGYYLTEEDIYLLASFVWAEAGQEPPEVQQAVAEVVLNRLVSGEYPNTVQDVIRKTELCRAVKTMQTWDEESNDPYLAVDAAMYGPYILPEEVCFYSPWEQGEERWGQLGSYTFWERRRG